MTGDLAGLVHRSLYEITGRRARRPGHDRYGASVVGGQATIVTVRVSSGGSWVVDPTKSRAFVLRARDQQSLRRLHAGLHSFIRERGIEELYLRKAECARGYSAKVETYLCEGVLCLIPGLVVHQISALYLSHWMRANDFSPDRKAKDRSWHYAIAAALHSAAGAGAGKG